MATQERSVYLGAMTAIDDTNKAAPRLVICMKWGTKYGPEYVDRLYGMVRRHLTGPLRFVCLTDDATGVRPEVECLPLPYLDVKQPAGPDRAWKKLTIFNEKLHGLSGTALFLDLDIVIVDNIDCFFEAPGEFLIIHDWKRPWRITGNSSVYRFELLKHGDVLSHFVANFPDIRRQHRNEQAYLSEHMHQRGLMRYWPAEWCASFKYHCIPSWPTNFWREPVFPPATKIVVFHGEVNPPDALLGRRNRRFRFIQPARWISRYWQP